LTLGIVAPAAGRRVGCQPASIARKYCR
jgi:hypothetical protein